MSEVDIAKRHLADDVHAYVVMQLDEFSHVQAIELHDANGMALMTLSRPSLDVLVREGVLLPANRLTPERTYVHPQPYRGRRSEP